MIKHNYSVYKLKINTYIIHTKNKHKDNVKIQTKKCDIIIFKFSEIPLKMYRVMLRWFIFLLYSVMDNYGIFMSCIKIIYCKM